jgi:hypothetical protein
MAGTIVADTIQAAATSTLLIQTGNGAPTTAITVSPTQNVTVAGTTTLTGGVVGDLKFNSGYGSIATAYGCRAWVNFDGTGTFSPNPSTTKIRASGNVTSITDNGTGDYTVNFTTAMPNVNYSFVATSGDGTGGSTSVSGTFTYAVGSIRFQSVDASGNTSVDCAFINVAIFR